MFSYLSKLLPLFLYPVGLLTLLLLAALLLRKQRRLQTTVLVIAFGVVWLGGNRLVAMTLTASLENQFPPLVLDTESLPKADAIVILGGVTRPGDYPRPMAELNEAGDRLLYGAALYDRGVAPLILVSGGGAMWQGPEQVPEAVIMAAILAQMGVPADAIQQERLSLNTAQNAAESLALLEELGAQRAILVTSALHMPRAHSHFTQSDLTIIPAPIDFFVTDADWAYYTTPDWRIQLFNLVPSGEDLVLTSQVMKEYLGLLEVWITS